MKINNKITLKITTAAAIYLFSNAVYAQNSELGIINNYFRQSKNKSENSFKILNNEKRASLGGDIVSIQQTVEGVPVYGAVSSVLIKNDEVKYFSDRFVDVTTGSGTYVSAKSSKFDIKSNFSKILSDMGLKTDASKYRFEGRNSNTVVSQQVYFPDTDNKLILAYAVNFFEEGTNNYWDVVVDAVSGKILSKSNLTVSCSFSDHAYSYDQTSEQKHTHFDDLKTSAKSNDDASASYRVFALPVEAPTFGNRTLETNPWFSDASPLGWHNDGEDIYTITRGNNAYAYLDLNGSNAIGTSADGGANHIFDFPLDLTKDIDTYTDAAITNLFYTTNKMHDIFYRYGFDEEGRNFQGTNFGKGEAYTDEDPVLAEARDGGGVNNANFATPQDGFAPRMQMYLWKYGYAYLLSYNSPEEMKDRRPTAGYNSNFGGSFPVDEPITGDVVLANPLDACTDLQNTNLTGKIALIQRGSCNFDLKFKKAQDKGATAVIIYNADPTQTIGYMTGTDTTVTIPGILVNNEEGTLIKSKIDAGTNVNASLQYHTEVTSVVDGSLDNSIITHEYTHGISTRSTGNGYSCLNAAFANEQMGEGWSDFFALMVTNKPNATSADARGMGTFAYNEQPTDLGIRPAKYSPDFSINSYTYGDTNGMYYDSGDGVLALDVHSIGFVWATMLWDLQWKFADKYGFSNDIANNPNSGSGKIVQLVMDAMKLQGCYPNFVTGRDAIIAADEALNNGENKCMIWETFANRGLGVNADPGMTRGALPGAISDQKEDFTVPAECQNLATSDVNSASRVSVYPNPVKNDLHIVTQNKNAGKTKIAVYDISGKLINQEMVNLSSGETTVDMSGLPNGVYVVKGEGIGVQFSKKIVVKK